jgi:hypothetical protein
VQIVWPPLLRTVPGIVMVAASLRCVVTVFRAVQHMIVSAVVLIAATIIPTIIVAGIIRMREGPTA